MNEKLSALMDGELDRDAAAVTIKALGSSDAHRKDWDCYHLIGDAMRDEAIEVVTHRQASTNAIFAMLAAEPTVLAPAAIRGGEKSTKATPVQQRTRFALAMAASVVTVSAIGVVAFKQQQGNANSQSQLAQQTSPLLPVSSIAAPEMRVNDYLLVHRQFANPAALQAAALKRTDQRQAAAK